MIRSRRNRARNGAVKGCYCCSEWHKGTKVLRAREKRAWMRDQSA